MEETRPTRPTPYKTTTKHQPVTGPDLPFHWHTAISLLWVLIERLLWVLIERFNAVVTATMRMCDMAYFELTLSGAALIRVTL
jgi:hypothetical protein